MRLEEQIKELLRKKAKVDLYSKLIIALQAELDSASTDKDHQALEKEFPGVFVEFFEEVSAFLHRQKDSIGNVRVDVPAAIAAAPAPQVEAGTPLPPPPPEEEPTDPLKFMLKWRHLHNRTVEIATPNGAVRGKVQGLVTPNLIIQTELGYNIKVTPKHVREISE